MNLKEAFEHLIKNAWQPPNKTFIMRFNRGEISDNRIRSILIANEYYRAREESWAKSKRKYNRNPL